MPHELPFTVRLNLWRHPRGFVFTWDLETQLSDSWDCSLCLLVWRLDFPVRVSSGSLLRSLRVCLESYTQTGGDCGWGYPERLYLSSCALTPAFSRPLGCSQQGPGVSRIHPVWLLPSFRLPTQSAPLGSYQLSCPTSGPWQPLPWVSQAPAYLTCVPQDTVLLRDFCARPHVPGEGLEERMRRWVTRRVTRAPWDSSPPPQLTSGIRSLSKAQPASPRSLLRRLLFRPGFRSRPRASLSSNSSCLGFLAPWFFHRFLTTTIT